MKSDSKMITRLFFSLLPIQIMMVAIASVNGIIDSVFASNYIGPYAMAITGLYMPVTKVFETVNAVMLGGSQILCGQFLGKSRLDRTRGIFSLDIVLVTAFSALLTLICMAAPDKMAGALGADETIRQGLKYYILGISPGILPMMLGVQLTSFLQIERQEKRTYTGIAAMMATNCLLDYIFIVMLDWGTFGLGLATTLSYAVFYVVLGSFYFTKDATIKFDAGQMDIKDLRPIILIGIPGALVTFCLAVRGLILNSVLLDCSGNDGLSALSALNNCGYLLYAVTAGIAAATRILISVYIGEEDRDSLIAVMKTALLKGVPLVCAVSAMVIAFAGPITYVFFKDPSSNVYYLTLWLFRIFPLSMPLSAICVIFINYYQSSSRMGIVDLLSASDGLLGIGAASLVLAPLYGAMGVWAAHVVNGIITTAIIIVYAWIKNSSFPKNVEDLMTLPDDFGVQKDQYVDILIHNKEDVTDTSRLITEFCMRNGVDKKRAFYAGLCMEEMAANIVEHGFSDGKKHHYADVRVVYKDDKLLLRIKDDCIPFNPEEQMKLIDPDDLTRNIGLRMVQKLAKTMSYTNMLGMNVLTMTI